MRPMLAVVAGLLLLAGLPAAAMAAPGEEADGGYVDPGEAEFDEIEVLRRKAASEGEWQQDQSEQIAVDRQVLRESWVRVPFDQRPFDYTPDQIRDNWQSLIGNNFQLPYPSAQFLRDIYTRFPAIRNAHPEFDGDFERLERELGDVWRLFMRGDYQLAMQRGEALGPMGRVSGKTAQMIYAIYLQPNLAKKHMLLQDAANVIREQGEGLEQLKKSKEQIYRNTYVVGRIAYTYAIGRIAEDVPIPVAIGRNYVFKVLGAIDDVRTLAPENPLGYAASAAADANVVRKVGKATGRITFGAKQANIRTYFEQALRTSDMAMIRYEYANALLYVNKKRDIDEAIEQLKRSAKTQPRFAMEALDAMYASKRRREVEALARSTASFRSFERKRLKYQKEHNENLYCVLPGTCKPFIIQ
ncbi:MAG: hypothetical protein ACOY33_07115 [Pseudomonadota bacterium]